MCFFTPLRRAGSLAKSAARRRPRAATALLSLAVATASGSAALANDVGVATVKGVTPPTISVQSNGNVYTGVTDPEVMIEADVDYLFKPYKLGKVESFGIWLVVRTSATGWISFKENKFGASYPIGSRPDDVAGSANLVLFADSYEKHFVKYCNDQRKVLEALGQSKQQIFSEDRIIEVAVSAAEEYDFTLSGFDGNSLGSGGESWPTYHKINLICERDPNIPMIADSSLSATVVQKNQIANACELRLNGSISTHGPNVEVKLRYVEEGGQKSGVKTITTGADGKKDFQHTYTLDPEVQSGKIRMVGIDPAFTSNWASYEVDCSEPASNDIQVFLPPQAKAMAFDVDTEILRYGMACPRFVEVTGSIEGRGKVSGKIIFMAGGQEISGTGVPYSIDDGETQFHEVMYEIPWQTIPASQTKHSANFGMYVANGQGQVVSQLEGTKHFECYEPLPPKPVALYMNVTQEIERNGTFCPSEIKIRSFVKGGGGAFAGTAVFTANADQSDPQPLSIPGTDIASTAVPHQVSWQNVSGYEQYLELSVYVYDGDGNVVGAKSGTEFLQCRNAVKVEAVGSASVLEQTVHDNMVCPSVIQISAKVASLGPAFSGTLHLGANTQQIGQESVSVDAAANGVAAEASVAVPYPVVWQDGDGFEKNIQLSASIFNSDGHKVHSTWAPHVISCAQTNLGGQALAGSGSEGAASGPGTADPASRGRLALGEIAAAPSTGQTARERPVRNRTVRDRIIGDRPVGGRTQGPAAGRIASAPAAFTILSPKGRLRPGPRAQIRLSGAVPEGGYTLRFYRKDKGRYKLVRLASLPQSMNSNTQLLRINALRSAAHWRVEVCPANANRQACKTSDFTLPRGRGAGSGDKKPEIMLITPGAINTN